MLIPGETASNAGDYLTDQLGAGHQREHTDALYFWIPEQVQDEDFSIKKEKNCANMGKMLFIVLVLQCCSIGKIGIPQNP